jgi:hypothetical protein
MVLSSRQQGGTTETGGNMTMERNRHNQFPASFRLGLNIPEGWQDSSWGNDVCPSFLIPAAGLKVFIDHEDPSQREIEDAPRFSVHPTDADGNVDYEAADCCILETESWDIVLHTIADRLRDMADAETNSYAESHLRDLATSHWLLTAEAREEGAC